MWAICAVYANAYTSDLQMYRAFLNIAPSIFVLASYVDTMVLTSERH